MRGVVAAFALSVVAVAAPVAADPLDAALGKALFDRPWATAPTVTRADDGLGPLYIARSCVACHPAGGGRGVLPPGVGASLRLADDPVYGRQLQTAAVAGQDGEGRLTLREEKRAFRYPDGAQTELRRLVPAVADPAFGPVTAALSLRLAPPLYGLGLLEQTGARFGWKADQPDLPHQAAAAFQLDIGMSTPFYPEPWGDCTAAQTACRAAPHGDSPEFDGLEIHSAMLDLLAVYLRALPPPAPAQPDPAGAALFDQTGCAGCHTPGRTLPDGRVIAPYSDMALHDMGAGLSDAVPGVAACGAQWRTPPLWGLRDAPRDAAGRLALLHDGRARSVEEAVLWHDGEAAAARDRFAALSRRHRQTLLRFVGAL